MLALGVTDKVSRSRLRISPLLLYLSFVHIHVRKNEREEGRGGRKAPFYRRAECLAPRGHKTGTSAVAQQNRLFLASHFDGSSGDVNLKQTVTSTLSAPPTMPSTGIPSQHEPLAVTQSAGWQEVVPLRGTK